ncbi:MAG: ThuA domain-containing protein [Armatimonadetes bacterium]|nr:ThuA domain-containing protein [Armatimonadota bacterium]MDE2207798.1 ThuA domain-containing protein [Armatimonadota bacterium]
MPRLTRRSLLAAGGSLGASLLMGAAEASSPRTVVVWSERTAPRRIYPHDINAAIADGIRGMDGWDVVTANIDEPAQGLPDELLNRTSVLIWWGHLRHDQVKDDLAARIAARVRSGSMGFIGTHSAHWSKPFKALMGTACGWAGGYVEDGSRLNVVVMAPKHPIARDVRDFVVPHTERYTEPFDVPPPQTLVFDGIYTLPAGSTQESRQGMTWQIGAGRVFYFQPGHEDYPIYYQPEIRHVFRNGILWVNPRNERHNRASAPAGGR